MNEQTLRTLVREAVARHLRSEMLDTPAHPSSKGRHPSHRLFVGIASADSDGMCLIEPAVGCNHCGYCRSLGH